MPIYILRETQSVASLFLCKIALLHISIIFCNFAFYFTILKIKRSGESCYLLLATKNQ